MESQTTTSHGPTNFEMALNQWRKFVAELIPLCERLLTAEGLNDPAKVKGDIVKNPQEVAQLVNKIRELISPIGSDVLRFKPVNPARLWADSFCALVHEQSEVFETSIFGLRFSGNCIPLHDHPRMYGFIRPLHGRVKIHSFSWIDPADEKKFKIERAQKMVDSAPGLGCPPIMRPARYDGQLVLSSECEQMNIAVLDPKTANLHKIEALDDGAAFFDLLVPGYRTNRTCTYYTVFGGKEPYAVGDIVWLQGSEDVPEHFTMQQLQHDSSNQEILKNP